MVGKDGGVFHSIPFMGHTLTTVSACKPHFMVA